ncbi:MAG: glucokinase, partial [Candidatus Electrothrix sp. AR3]|nr:glucokinase [Candidatus Electrothrix sp. AR3]
GVMALPAEQLIVLNPGQATASGSIGVLAAGTGLGQAFALPLNNRMQPFPTEGGHAAFGPRSQEEIALLQFMMARQGERRGEAHVSVEQVCSGMAIPDLYAFMLSRYPEPEWMAKKRLQVAAGEETPLLVAAANDALAGGPACEPAVYTMQLFADILAAEAANLALKMLTTGGIYLGGGMVLRLLSFFTPERFMQIFCHGVYRELLAGIPVSIMIEPQTALIGAWQLALHPLENLS